MESAAKRKAASAAVGDSDGRPAKRQKVPASPSANAETAESTTTKGLQFLESLKQAKDKTGRPIATHFLALPSKSELPEYYELIKLPIAIDTIEDKLEGGEYTSLAQVESDCKRMVNNAKAFNDKNSIVYQDAERLRKTASNWMTKHNPAYRDGNYQAIATPVPGEENHIPGKPIPRIASTPRTVHSPSTPDTFAERPRRAAAAAQSTPAPSKLRQSASVAPEVEDNPDFDGKTFQQAQEQIVNELIGYVEPDGLQIFLPFVNLPSRSLKDYYQLIKEPMSLTAVKKKVMGVVGREQPTGHTLYKSWDALADHMSLIWLNARDYNEDGSDIYNVSMELEDFFNKRLAEAKAKVDEPPQPKLKLNMSGAAPAPKQQLKLKLRQSPGSDSNTPGARSSTTPGVIVDNEALLRQQRHVQSSMHTSKTPRTSSQGQSGTPAAPNPFSGPKGATAAITPLPGAHTKTAGSPPAINGVKQDVQSPALSAIRPASTASDGQRLSVPAQTPHAVMAPPRPTSGSPYPNGPLGQQSAQTNGYHPPPSYPIPPSALRLDIFRKEPLKSIDEALIPKITLNTHPALNLPKPWFVDVFANKQKTEHSATIIVDPTHSYLQIAPKVPIALTNRLYRLFVSVNGNKTFEVNRVPVTAGINGSSPGPGYEGGKKKGEPVFEAKLVGGVNRIEVEIVAEKDRKGAPETSNGKEQIEVEKCTIFLHLVRQASY
ncbi:Bromodomain-containing protein [Setomelanomma holmii]|uniref:Bromodomain-containing protein n=1 Tax=Setomelanomma holmii TaxID=210430 RepID=A0A9P4H084_9PLEO|nr:Bromodomain-containing protein [Setomelanomma holmii]